MFSWSEVKSGSAPFFFLYSFSFSNSVKKITKKKKKKKYGLSHFWAKHFFKIPSYYISLKAPLPVETMNTGLRVFGQKCKRQREDVPKVKPRCW